MLHLSSPLKRAASSLLFGLFKDPVSSSDYVAQLIIGTSVFSLGFVSDPQLTLTLGKEVNLCLLMCNIWGK
jgi:hypothetical protein